MRLAVTIDTEADNQWQPGIPITTRNVAYWGPFQEICDRYGVKPTYLVASEITEDERAVALLQEWIKDGSTEVGAHLHPWTTPPFLPLPGLRYNDPEHAFPSQLPPDLLRKKTRVLTEQVASAFSMRPTSYRAGRFGISTEGAACLAAEGYLVDSSVTPYTNWGGTPGLSNAGGPSFPHQDPKPFRIAGTGNNSLLEIPVTVLPTYPILHAAPPLLRAYRTLPARAVRKLLLSRWLLPQPMWLSLDPRYTADNLTTTLRCAAGRALSAAVMIFHSSELMPGCSPFRPDAQSISDLLSCLDAFFRTARQDGVRFLTLTELAEEVVSEGGLITAPLLADERPAAIQPPTP